MKGKISDEIRLRHILDAIIFIEKFSAGKSKQDLYTDYMYRFSVERQLEIIGEAANNLSPAIILHYADVPWQQIISFRNFIVHEYFGLDLELVWNVIDIHVPVFKVQVENILKGMSDQLSS
jgi:uncharacterized protein with HEPN domain